jgi:N-acetylglutamate synthase-like GNAT family acetyltransferase
MPAVSQALIEFANHHRQPPAPGIEVIDTPRYRVTLQPDFPIPGPNSVTWVRCSPEEADEVIREARAIVAARGLPVNWILDPQTQPADFADHLARHGIGLDGEAAVMVLPIDADLVSPQVEGLQVHDALVDPEAFRKADDINSEAFGSVVRSRESQERRRKNQLSAGNRRLLLATVDGEPAGSAGLTLYPPAGAIINGGAVLSGFRGRGVYRALIAARLAMAREAGVAGLAVWGGSMSAPILAGLGFVTVGSRKFYK